MNNFQSPYKFSCRHVILPLVRSFPYWKYVKCDSKLYYLNLYCALVTCLFCPFLHKSLLTQFQYPPKIRIWSSHSFKSLYLILIIHKLSVQGQLQLNCRLYFQAPPPPHHSFTHISRNPATWCTRSLIPHHPAFLPDEFSFFKAQLKYDFLFFFF